MSNLDVQIEFPQPMVEAPEMGEKYWLIGGNGNAWDATWDGEQFDIGALACAHCYKTKELAEQRAAWNTQQMARLVIPAWFRALGPDVEANTGNGWFAVDLDRMKKTCTDWSTLDASRYRSKPRDVVVTVIVDGVSRAYRWPPEVAENVHAWMHDEIEQLAAIRAAAGAES